MSGPHLATPSALFLLVLVSESWSFCGALVKAGAFIYKRFAVWSLRTFFRVLLGASTTFS